MSKLYEPDKNLAVNISIRQGVRHNDPVTVELTVEDRISGEYLASVEIDPNSFLALLRGGQYNFTGFITPHLDRIGKEMITEIVSVPREVYAEVYYTEAENFLTQWVNEQPWDEWETRSLRRTNQGYKVVLRRWETPSE